MLGMVPADIPTPGLVAIDNMDRVFGEILGSAIPLSLPGKWRPFPDLELQLSVAPPPMAGHYLGWFRSDNGGNMYVPVLAEESSLDSSACLC